jgi:hypothetical protein
MSSSILRGASLASFALLFSISSAALAQDPAPPPAASATPIQAPAAAPSTGRVGCELGDHAGVLDAHAETAAAIVCAELLKTGAQPPTGAPGDGVYRVHLQPLGASAVLRITYEAPRGTVRAERHVMLARLEEITVAAPRLVGSLQSGASLAETQRVSNLTSEETRAYQKKKGETLWELGLAGLSVPGSGVLAAPGAYLRIGYELPHAAIGADFRFGTRSDNGKEAHFVALGVGARWFMTETDIGPYVGGGLAMTWLGYRESTVMTAYGSYPREYSGDGLAAFAEASVEMFRLHSSRLSIGLRVDVPFYTTKNNDPYPAPDANAPGGVTYEQHSDSKYIVPITFTVGYAW